MRWPGTRINWLVAVESGLGLAAGLALLRLVLRLLAADELSPPGQIMVKLGEWVSLPFRGGINPAATPRLPGAGLERESLLAFLIYLLIALGLAVAASIWNNRRRPGEKR